MVTAFAYVRVSTKEQDEEVQVKAIEEFCKRRGIEVVRVYVDKGEGGSKPFGERPAASALLRELDELRPDAVVVWSLDRLGRTMLDTLNTVMALEERGVRVLTVKEEWLQTLDANVRKLVLSVLAWFAEFERRRIRERQEEAWRQGKQKGRPRKLPPSTVSRYLKRYPGLSILSLWRIMKADGYNVGYTTLRRYVKELRSKAGEVDRQLAR